MLLASVLIVDYGEFQKQFRRKNELTKLADQTASLLLLAPPLSALKFVLQKSSVSCHVVYVASLSKP
jgi:hypothetical protein